MPLSTAPRFDAAAEHAALLPPGVSLEECCWFGGSSDGGCSGSSPPTCTTAVACDSGENKLELQQQQQQQQGQLLFQVWDKWADDSDSLTASCELPLKTILQLCQRETVISSGAVAPHLLHHHQDGMPATTCQTMVLPLLMAPGSGAAQVQAGAGSAVLSVTVKHSVTACYSLSTDLQQQGEQQQNVQQQQQQTEEEEEEEEAATALQLSVTPPQLTAAGAAEAAAPLLDAGAAVMEDCDRSLSAAAATLHVELIRACGLQVWLYRTVPCTALCPVLLSPALSCTALCACANSPCSRIHTQTHTRTQAPSHVDIYGQQVLLLPAAPNLLPAHPTLPLYLLLQDAVRDAERCLGSAGAGLLSRARQLGPHPFATLSLQLSQETEGSEGDSCADGSNIRRKRALESGTIAVDDSHTSDVRTQFQARWRTAPPRWARVCTYAYIHVQHICRTFTLTLAAHSPSPLLLLPLSSQLAAAMNHTSCICRHEPHEL